MLSANATVRPKARTFHTTMAANTSVMRVPRTLFLLSTVRTTGKRLERIAADAADAPVGHHRGSHLFVKRDRVGVPVEHAPFDTAAVTRDGELREVDEHAPADASAAMRRLHVQILEVQPESAQERREVGEEQRESDDRVIIRGDDALDDRMRAEQVTREVVGADNDLMSKPFEIGELADQRVNRRAVWGLSGPKADVAHGAIVSQSERKH